MKQTEKPVVAQHHYRRAATLVKRSTHQRAGPSHQQAEIIEHENDNDDHDHHQQQHHHITPENQTDFDAKRESSQQHRSPTFQEFSFLDSAPMDDDPAVATTGRRLANNMRVNSIIFQTSATTGAGQRKCNTCGSVNGVLDMASFITGTWKKQAEALSLTPVESVDFFSRHYRHLNTVLSINLFNREPDHGQDDAAAAAALSVTVEQDENGVEEARQRTGQKRKRTATPSNDCEYIFFEKDGRFVYRRVESAEKYAKRSKPTIRQYVCVVPRADEYREMTRNCAAKFRSDDSKFLSGSDVNFRGSYEALQRDLCDRIERNALGRYAVVKCVELGDSSNDKDDHDNDEPNEPSAAKKARRDDGADAKPSAVTTTPKRASGTKQSKVAKLDVARRTGVEDFTESEDSSESETEDGSALPIPPANKPNGSNKVPDDAVSPKVNLTRKTDPETDAAVRSIQRAVTPDEDDTAAAAELDPPPSPFLQRPTKPKGKKKHRDRATDDRAHTSKKQAKYDPSDLAMEIEDYCNSVFA